MVVARRFMESVTKALGSWQAKNKAKVDKAVVIIKQRLAKQLKEAEAKAKAEAKRLEKEAKKAAKAAQKAGGDLADAAGDAAGDAADAVADAADMEEGFEENPLAERIQGGTLTLDERIKGDEEAAEAVADTDAAAGDDAAAAAPSAGLMDGLDLPLVPVGKVTRSSTTLMPLDVRYCSRAH
jgi:hypothetical protein|eukprot:COSAG06_NODE_38_length_30373_cov_182.543536_10_plen_182_part_00